MSRKADVYGWKPPPVKAAPALLNPDGTVNSAGLIAKYEKAYAEAKAANEARYAEVLRGYRQRYDTGMSSLEGAGAQQSADIRADWSGQAAAGAQQLQSRGMGGTTIAPTMAMGYKRQELADQARLRGGLIDRRAALQAQLSGDTLGFQERRTDAYPDLGMYSKLMEGLGKGGTGAGAGARAAWVAPKDIFGDAIRAQQLRNRQAYNFSWGV